MDIRHPRVFEHIRYIDDGTVRNRAMDEASGWDRILPPPQPKCTLGNLMTCHEMDQSPIVAEHGAEHRVAQPDGVLGNGAEHWLGIGRRARDHTQNLTRGSLLLQSICQLTRSGLHLLK